MQELDQRIENAVAAYLNQYVGGDVTTIPVGQNIPDEWLWPKSLKGTDGNYRIYPGESDQIKDGQAIICVAEDSAEEYPLYAGNYYVDVEVWLRTPVKVNNAYEVTLKNPTALSFHEWGARQLSNAINQDAFLLAGYINSSGQDFTIFGGVIDRKPIRSQVPNFFASGWKFRVLAMNKVAP